MIRTLVALALCVSIAGPAAAQVAGPRVNFDKIVSDQATRLAIQTPTSSATPPPQPRTEMAAPELTSKDKMIYGISLAAAAAGTIFNIKETRDALDLGLKAKTFPFVWTTTSDPADKGKVTGTILAANGGLMVVSYILVRKGKAPLGSFLNFLIAGATTAVSFHDRQIINDAKAGK